jgi:hypothetical protein
VVLTGQLSNQLLADFMSFSSIPDLSKALTKSKFKTGQQLYHNRTVLVNKLEQLRLTANILYFAAIFEVKEL